MFLKIGTKRQLIQHKKRFHPTVYREVSRIVRILDGEYGAKRDIAQDDGGFLLIAQTIDELASLERQHIHQLMGQPEEIHLLNTLPPFLDLLYLKNNEFGIHVLLPIDLSPLLWLDRIGREYGKF